MIELGERVTKITFRNEDTTGNYIITGSVEIDKDGKIISISEGILTYQEEKVGYFNALLRNNVLKFWINDMEMAHLNGFSTILASLEADINSQYKV